MLSQSGPGFLLQNREQIRPDGVRDQAGSGGIRMDEVVAVELRIERNPRQEERHERRSVLCCEVWKDMMEIQGVVPSLQRWCLHSAQQNARIARLGRLDDSREILPNSCDWHPTQAVVGSERDNQHTR